jgi:hypothetical protein
MITGDERGAPGTSCHFIVVEAKLKMLGLECKIKRDEGDIEQVNLRPPTSQRSIGVVLPCLITCVQLLVSPSVGFRRLI